MCILFLKSSPIFLFTGDKVLLWWRTQRTAYGRLNVTKSGQGSKPPTERQEWVRRTFAFLKDHVKHRTRTTTMGNVSIEFRNAICLF